MKVYEVSNGNGYRKYLTLDSTPKSIPDITDGIVSRGRLIY
jgi:hypothetical protein